MSAQLHVCTKGSPMRVNSNPDDWTHPDATVQGEPWFTFGDPEAPIEIECVHRVCPYCDQAEQVRTGNTRPREIMP